MKTTHDAGWQYARLRLLSVRREHVGETAAHTHTVQQCSKCCSCCGKTTQSHLCACSVSESSCTVCRLLPRARISRATGRRHPLPSGCCCGHGCAAPSQHKTEATATDSDCTRTSCRGRAGGGRKYQAHKLRQKAEHGQVGGYFGWPGRRLLLPRFGQRVKQFRVAKLQICGRGCYYLGMG